MLFVFKPASQKSLQASTEKVGGKMWKSHPPTAGKISSGLSVDSQGLSGLISPPHFFLLTDLFHSFDLYLLWQAQGNSKAVNISASWKGFTQDWGENFSFSLSLTCTEYLYSTFFPNGEPNSLHHVSKPLVKQVRWASMAVHGLKPQSLTSMSTTPELLQWLTKPHPHPQRTWFYYFYDWHMG